MSVIIRYYYMSVVTTVLYACQSLVITCGQFCPTVIPAISAVNLEQNTAVVDEDFEIVYDSTVCVF